MEIGEGISCSKMKRLYRYIEECINIFSKLGNILKIATYS